MQALEARDNTIQIYAGSDLARTKNANNLNTQIRIVLGMKFEKNCKSPVIQTTFTASCITEE